MPSLNKTLLIGHLGKDPETRHMPDGKVVCNFSIATSETWKDKSGEKQERTEWHRISTFGRLAEICGEYLKKGSLVYIEGRIQTRKWTDKEGAEKYTTEIVADKLVMLGPRGGGGRDEGSDDDRPRGRQSGDRQQSSRTAQQSKLDDLDDDIPF